MMADSPPMPPIERFMPPVATTTIWANAMMTASETL